MSESDRRRIGDIRDAVDRIRAYCSGVSHSTFQLEPQLQDAVVRRLIIVGEAAAKLSVAARSRYGDVPWNSIVGMRHILVHDYGRADTEILWRTIKDDLPRLYRAIQQAER